MEYRRYAHTRLGEFRIEVSNGYLALGFGFDIGGGDSNDELQLALYLGLVSIWLTYGARWVRRIAKGISKLRGHKYTQQFGNHIQLHRGGAFSLEIGGDHMGDSAVFKYYVDISRALKGRAVVTREIIQEGETSVVMPEKKYAARYTIERLIWKHPRWFTQSRIDIKIEVPEGIPHEGKGENSYDCGMDYSYGMSLDYKDSLRDACDQFALYVIKSRQKYSALDQYQNVPSGLPTRQPMAGMAGAQSAA